MALSSRLTDLQRCLESKLITAEEHSEIRRRLLSEFCLQPEAGTNSRQFTGGASSPSRARRSSSPCTDGDCYTPLSKPFASPSMILGLHEPKDTVKEGEWWCDFIRSHISILNVHAGDRAHHALTMDDLHQFDVSGDRVREIFTLYDSNHDGHISPDELRSGLERWNRKLDLKAAEELIKRVIAQCRDLDEAGETDGPASLTELEFKLLLQRLRLAELFTPSAGAFQFEEFSSERPECPVWITDYSRARCDGGTLQLGKNEDLYKAIRYFFGSRSFRSKRMITEDRYRRDMRWVHINAVHGLDRLTLFRYAVKYHLHPLAVDDIIDNRTPTKLDRFEDAFFLSVDILSLDQEEPRLLRRGHREAGAPPRVRIHRCNASIFLSQAPDCDTILSIIQERPDESSWMAMWRRKQRHEVGASRPDYGMWDRLREDLRQSPPQLSREKRGDFLLYEMLDRVVDQLRPIGAAYAKRLGHMRQTPPSNYPQEWLSELDEVQLELRDIARSIRPMRQVLRHLIDDRSLTGSAMYFEDVEDGILEMQEDIAQLQEMCKTVKDDHEGHNDRKMNQTLYVLSVVSVMFLPGQFVTGVYGMNFVDADGHPTMPELTWENGYLYFWVLELFLIVANLLLFLHFTGLGLCESCSHRARQALPPRDRSTSFSTAQRSMSVVSKVSK